MKFGEVARLSRELALRRGRNAKVAVLAEGLAGRDPGETRRVTAWLMGEVAQRTGVGPAVLETCLRAVGASRPANTATGSPVGEVGREVADQRLEVAEVGREVAEVGREVAEVGREVAEVGREVADPRLEVAEAERLEGTEVGLEVAEVDARLDALAALSGAGSKERRQSMVVDLLTAMSPGEQAFLVGLLSGSLRQGALEGLVLAAVALAHRVDEAAVRRAVMLAGSLPEVAAALAERGPAALEGYRLTLFTPVAPMLAETAETLDEVSLSDMLLEAKLDGARVQIHKSGEVVRIWSRALNEVTESLPDVVAAIRAMPASEAILDGEVIALDPAGRPFPFQTTMKRFGRKRDVANEVAALPLTTCLFDILFHNDESLIDTPLAARRARLEALCAASAEPPSPQNAAPPALPISPPVRPTPSLSRPDAASARAFFAETLARGHEGLMLKRLDGRYEAGQRASGWLKLKPAKTLDLVVIGAEWGSGRRSGWLSNLHLAARDEGPEGVRWVMLGKTFKGLTDELLVWQTEALLQREVERDAMGIRTRPELVVEVAFQELEASTRYAGGVALRFARVRGYRPDKRPDQADTLATVRSIFERSRGAIPP